MSFDDPKLITETFFENSEIISIINGIWKFITYHSDLYDTDVWQCKHIREVAKHLVSTVQHGSNTPIGFVEILATDFRKYKTHLERVDHISLYIGRSEICEYSVSYNMILARSLTFNFSHLLLNEIPLQRHDNSRCDATSSWGFNFMDGTANYADEINNMTLEISHFSQPETITYISSYEFPIGIKTDKHSSTVLDQDNFVRKLIFRLLFLKLIFK